MIATRAHFFSEALTSYADALLKLRAVFARGEGDTEAADAIRDEMDAPWYEMSKPEQQLASILAADLNRLEDAQAPRSAMPQTQRQIQELIDVEDWIGVLKTLHEHDDKIPAAVTAFLRGIAWQELSQPAVSLEFMIEAHRLDPRQPEFTECLIAQLLRCDQIDEAARIAENALAGGPVRPALYFKAIEAISLNALTERVSTQPATYESLIQRVQEAIQLGIAAQDGALKPAIANAYVDLALALHAVGRIKESQNACLESLSFVPGHADALLLLGWLFVDEKAPQTLGKDRFFDLFARRLSEASDHFIDTSNLLSIN